MSENPFGKPHNWDIDGDCLGLGKMHFGAGQPITDKLAINYIQSDI